MGVGAIRNTDMGGNMSRFAELRSTEVPRFFQGRDANPAFASQVPIMHKSQPIIPTAMLYGNASR